MKKITFIGWKPGFNKVDMTKLLRNSADVSLGDAKKIVDSILEGKHVSIQVELEEVAIIIFNEAAALGAIVEIASQEERPH